VLQVEVQSLGLSRMALTGMLVGNAHPTVYQGLQRSKTAYFSAIGFKSVPFILTQLNRLDSTTTNFR